MNRTRLRSSMIKSAGYEPEAKILEIEFKSGSLYRYHGVSEEVFLALQNARSAGHFFEQYIKQGPYMAVQVK
jgi:hypothetical protein